MTREEEHIVTTDSDSEYDVWKEGGYWKIHFKGQDRFITILVSADGSEFVHFDQINKDSFPGKLILTTRQNKVPISNPEGRKGLELGWRSGLFPQTNVVKSIRPKN
jgi:hypothetical protein